MVQPFIKSGFRFDFSSPSKFPYYCYPPTINSYIYIHVPTSSFPMLFEERIYEFPVAPLLSFDAIAFSYFVRLIEEAGCFLTFLLFLSVYCAWFQPPILFHSITSFFLRHLSGNGFRGGFLQISISLFSLLCFLRTYAKIASFDYFY